MPRAGCSIRLRMAGAALLAAFVAVAPAATPRPEGDLAFACTALACGMPARGAFPHFVVGRVTAIADTRDAARLFHAMRASGHWAGLPAGAQAFWAHVQPAVIDAGDAAFVVLTGRDEMRAAPLVVGDLVRYSPHRGRFEVPPADAVGAAYWAVDGCVATLCRAADHACFERYAAGVFRTSDGTQLSSASLAPLAYGKAVDIATMVPRAPTQPN